MDRERGDVSGVKGGDEPLPPIFSLYTVGTRSLVSGFVPALYRECTEVDPCLHPHFIRSCRGCDLL